MKPGFALSLSFDGISLLIRDGTGWRQVGDVRVDAPDLASAMAALQTRADALSQGPLRTKLVLPNDQIRYLTLETGDVDRAERIAVALRALDGATPYAVDDLAFDISQDGPVTHVAAVAKETLAEAEGFAVEHRFGPVSFVALPKSGDFVGEPFFGETEHAELILYDGEQVARDTTAIHILGPVLTEPALAAATSATPAPPSIAAPDSVNGVGMAEPAAGFSSRRRRPSGEADEAADVIPIPAAEGTPPPPARPAPNVAPAGPRVDARVDARSGAPVSAPVAPPAAPAAHPNARPNGIVVSPRPQPAALARAPGVAAGSPATAALRAAAAAIPDEDPENPRAGFISRRRDASVPLPDPANSAGVSDAERMTVFGARQEVQTRGKPRFLGLILTAILIVVLLGVAAFASIFADNRLARLFGRGAPEPEIAATADPEPAPAAPQITTIDPAILEISPEILPAPDSQSAGADVGPGNIVTEAPALDVPFTPDQTTPEVRSAPDTDVDAAARARAALDLSDPLSDRTETMLDAMRLPAQQDEPAQPTTTDVQDSQAANYAATGIWSDAPEHPDTPGLISLDDLYVAAIDGATLTQDALALPPVRFYDTDISLNGQASPAAAGIAFKLDALGLVDPSPEGTVTPDGIQVFLGRPPVVPPPTPQRVESTETAEPLVPDLPRTRPRARPTDLIESAERAQLGGWTLTELAEVRPRERPYEPEIAEEPAEPELTEAEARLAALRPKARPRDLAESVARSEEPATRTPSAGPAAAASTASTANLAQPIARNNAPAVPRNQTARPTAPSPTTVAKQATIKNAINLRQVNLIGVFGTPSNRRALVRLSSGRYKKVKVGDRIDGGQIVAIGDSELRYQKGGRNVTLRMPSG